MVPLGEVRESRARRIPFQGRETEAGTRAERGAHACRWRRTPVPFPFRAILRRKRGRPGEVFAQLEPGPWFKAAPQRPLAGRQSSQPPGAVRPASFAAGVGGQGRAPQAGDAHVGARKAWGSRVCSADDVGRTASTACVERPPSPSSSTGAVGLVPLVRVATSVASSPRLSPSPPTPKTACYLKPRA